MGGSPNAGIVETDLSHWVQSQPLKMNKPEVEQERAFSQGASGQQRPEENGHGPCPPALLVPCLLHCPPCLDQAGAVGLLPVTSSSQQRLFWLLQSLPSSSSSDEPSPPCFFRHFSSQERGDNLAHPTCFNVGLCSYRFWMLLERRLWSEKKSVLCFVQVVRRSTLAAWQVARQAAPHLLVCRMLAREYMAWPVSQDWVMWLLVVCNVSALWPLWI